MAAAVAIGRHFQVPDQLILKAIAAYEPDNARSQIIKKGKTTIILDAYNANPDSMKVALENLSEQGKNTMAILGDMNELEDSNSQHMEILTFAKKVGIKQVLTVGQKFGWVADPEYHFETKEKLEEHIKKLDFTDSTVLLKASRSIKLETILKSIG